MENAGTLIILSGLPGVGKTTVAREITARKVVTYVRVDSIEEGLATSLLKITRAEDAGHRAGWAVVRDNLLPGRVVLVEAVNEIPWCREGWIAVARDAGANFFPVELICSDTQEHRHRVESRGSNWQQVLARTWQSWTHKRLLIDTSVTSARDAATLILADLP